ncbi:hypothetical protein AVEN_18737-1 [Araneus ventricosus]|uniref:Uncharacterized protein n=1 Tax=Araneus ventricosus TaxID=182803 RepID=A0A4Y2GPD2_ARAVE|nr:hypothetical protein AVEN_18737-1 [Araneus ventricosus]
MLTNLHVLDLPQSEKHNCGIMSVCELDNSKTIRATGMKFVARLIIPRMSSLTLDDEWIEFDLPISFLAHDKNTRNLAIPHQKYVSIVPLHLGKVNKYSRQLLSFPSNFRLSLPPLTARRRKPLQKIK